MARDTSIESYRHVMESGLVAKKQKEVYSMLFAHGPMTANETFNKIAGHQGGMNYDSNTRARFTELRSIGVIREIGTKLDDYTHRRAILWDVTTEMPRERIKPRASRADTIKAMANRIFELERQNRLYSERLVFIELLCTSENQDLTYLLGEIRRVCSAPQTAPAIQQECVTCPT